MFRFVVGHFGVGFVAGDAVVLGNVGQNCRFGGRIADSTGRDMGERVTGYAGHAACISVLHCYPTGSEQSGYLLWWPVANPACPS